ncbi:MAG: dephospho-CoA kinase [Candidatus Omnitrophica bacterium]|nr:dephospho-CoA kinase [Candidatus Omnitrophota bacterium]
MKKNVVIGVTGQLGTGKSTVAAMFAEFGASVINADLLAHRALRSRGACYRKVVKTFGKGILSKTEIDHAKLSQIVFADEKQLRKLENIVHPFVIKETRKQVAAFKRAGQKVIILDVPLLFETGMDKLTDMTIAVKASKVKQLARCARQGRLNRSQAIQRMRFQLPMFEKVRRADMIVNNDGTLSQTKKQVKKIWEVIQRRYIY